MILVRPFEEADRGRINEIFQAQKLEYDAPDWGKILVSAVVEVDGKITMAAFLRKTAETYFVMDGRAGRKRDRVGQLLMLHRELLIPARRVGFEDVHCWLPPEMEKDFGKLLMHFGWVRPLWPNFCYTLPKE